jgi:hypothetical protein
VLQVVELAGLDGLPGFEQVGEQTRCAATLAVVAFVGHEAMHLVVAAAESPVEDERHHVRDVVDEVIAAGRDHELVGAARTLSLEPVDCLEHGAGDLVDVGGADDGAGR